MPHTPANGHFNPLSCHFGHVKRLSEQYRLIVKEFVPICDSLDELTEWLRCCTRNAMVFRRGSSNLPLVEKKFAFCLLVLGPCYCSAFSFFVVKSLF